MPSFELTSPTGETFVVDAPDSATPEQIQSQLSGIVSQFPQPQASTLPPEPEMAGRQSGQFPPIEPYGANDSFMDSVTWGLGTRVIGAGNALADIATTDATLKDFPERYKARYGENKQALKDYRSENPKMGLATDLAGGVVGGGMPLMNTAKLGGFNMLKKAMPYAAAEGAITGAARADEGDAGQNAIIGGVAGPVSVGALGLAGKLLGSAPKAIGGLSNLVTNTQKTVKPSAVDGDARTALAVMADRLGIAFDNVVDDASLPVAARLKGGNNLLKSLAAHSDDAMKNIENSGILERADVKKSAEMLRKATNLGDDQIDGILVTEATLDNNIKQIGKKLNDQVIKNRDKAIGNQDEIFMLLEKPGNKGVMKEALDSMKNRGKPIPRDPAATDPNAIFINEELAQEIASVMSGRVAGLRPTKFQSQNTSKYANAVNLYKEFDELLVASTKDGKLRKLRSDYAKANREQEALQEGLMGRVLKDDIALTKKFKNTPDPTEQKLLRQGVRGNLASGDSLMQRLENPDTGRRINKILGEGGETNNFQRAVNRENAIAETAQEARTGINHRRNTVSGQTIGGKTQDAPESIVEALAGKRAYGWWGLMSMFGNEIIMNINKTDLPDVVNSRIAKMVTESGGDGDKIIKRLLNSDLPKYQKEKALRAVHKAMYNTGLTATTGAGVSNLTDRMSGL